MVTSGPGLLRFGRQTRESAAFRHFRTPSKTRSQHHAFKTGFFAGETLAQLNNSVPGGFSPFSYYSIPQHFDTPKYAEWSFEVEQAIGPKNAVVVTYAGNHGYNLLINNPFPNAYAPGGFTGLPTAAPDPQFLNVTQLTTNGISNYDGLSFQFRRAFAYGFQGQVNYTWSHALDDISNGGSGLPFTFNQAILTDLATPTLARNYGNSDYDIRSNFLADFVWDTPWKFNRRALTYLLSDWTLSSKFFIRSGLPESITDGALAGRHRRWQPGWRHSSGNANRPPSRQLWIWRCHVALFDHFGIPAFGNGNGFQPSWQKHIARAGLFRYRHLLVQEHSGEGKDEVCNRRQRL